MERVLGVIVQITHRRYPADHVPEQLGKQFEERDAISGFRKEISFSPTNFYRLLEGSFLQNFRSVFVYSSQVALGQLGVIYNNV